MTVGVMNLGCAFYIAQVNFVSFQPLVNHESWKSNISLTEIWEESILYPQETLCGYKFLSVISNFTYTLEYFKYCHWVQYILGTYLSFNRKFVPFDYLHLVYPLLTTNIVFSGHWVFLGIAPAVLPDKTMIEAL